MQRMGSAGMKAPESGLYTAEIRVTRACNLRCRHCSVAAGSPAEKELTREEIEGVLDDLAGMGALYVVFTGGEPLLRPDITDLVAYASSRGLQPSIDTNGLLLTSEAAEDLKRAGVSTVQVSLDGAKKTHEAIRGEGSYDGAVSGIKNALSQGIYTTINFTISRMNQGDLEDVIELARELGVRALSMERFTPTGRGAEMRDALQSPEEFKKSLETLFSAEGLRTSSTDPLSIFLKDGFVARYSGDELGKRICGGCTAGVAAITISYDGQVYPCPKLEVPCGNIRDRGLPEIWAENRVINRLRFRELNGACGTCRWRNLCGGCRAVAMAESGNYLGEDPGCFIEAGP